MKWLRKIVKQPFRQYGKYKVYLVNGPTIRNTSLHGEEFSDSGTAADFKFIPQNEIWVENDVDPADRFYDIEQALNLLRQGSLPTPTQFLDSTGLVTGNYKVDNLTTYSLYVKELETAQLDLTGFPGANLLIRWTKKGDVSEDKTTCSEGSGTMSAALEISAIMSGSNTIERSYLNPSDCDISGNNFESSSDGGVWVSQRNYVVPANTTSLRLRPIYSGATIAVTGALVTDQMYVIQSSGSGGDAQKEIQVKRGLDAPASVFDFALFSGTTIVK